MLVELLYTEGCPNVAGARILLTEVLEEEGISAAVREIRVDSRESAVALRFPGTPTIRIDGFDVEKAARSAEAFGLEPRLYIRAGMITGSPTRGTIREAIYEARERARATDRPPN